MTRTSGAQPPSYPGLGTSPEDRLLVAMLAVGRHLKPRDPGQLDPGAFIALHAVGCYEPVRLTDLAGRLQLDASTVSRHVRNLERAGYVARAADPADRRAAQISLSAAGRTVLQRMFEARRVKVAAAFAGWSAADRDQLVALLGRLADDIARTDFDRTDFDKETT